MWANKRKHYAEHLEEMARPGLRYVPLVFSCYGRVHADSAVELEHIARQATLRLGIADHQPLLRRTMAGIGVAIWRRAAAMTKACLPRLSKESMLLLLGDADSDDECIAGES